MYLQNNRSNIHSTLRCLHQLAFSKLSQVLIILICGSLLFSAASFAAPKQIILLRHADKLSQKEPGPALSAKGYARAIKFTYYFLSQFGEPDFIIAGDPKNKDSSIRELQTVGPLVNLLAARHPDTGVDILHPYTHDEQDKLAKFILSDKKFNNKTILICWRHTKIIELAKALGVENNLEKWPDDDYDSVFVIHYDNHGAVSNTALLNNQYPMMSDVSWDDIFNRLRDL